MPNNGLHLAFTMSPLKFITNPESDFVKNWL